MLSPIVNCLCIVAVFITKDALLREMLFEENEEVIKQGEKNIFIWEEGKINSEILVEKVKKILFFRVPRIRFVSRETDHGILQSRCRSL